MTIIPRIIQNLGKSHGRLILNRLSLLEYISYTAVYPREPMVWVFVLHAEGRGFDFHAGVRHWQSHITESPPSIDIHGVKRDLDENHWLLNRCIRFVDKKKKKKKKENHWCIQYHLHRVLWALGRSILGTLYFFTTVHFLFFLLGYFLCES